MKLYLEKDISVKGSIKDPSNVVYDYVYKGLNYFDHVYVLTKLINGVRHYKLEYAWVTDEILPSVVTNNNWKTLNDFNSSEYFV